MARKYPPTYNIDQLVSLLADGHSDYPRDGFRLCQRDRVIPTKGT